MSPFAMAEEGLVAHYTFDEGAGEVAHDAIGNRNDSRIHGAGYARNGSGYCLEFDGVDDRVECGNGPSLDLRDAVTLAAWVYPEGRPAGEPGIVGKHFDSFLLSYDGDSGVWWYISGGGDHCRTTVLPGAWHQIAVTFDGHQMRLFLNGKLADAVPSKHSRINAGRGFFIGCVIGDPQADDPALARTAYFSGKIDEVRVYGRALAGNEIRARFEPMCEHSHR